MDNTINKTIIEKAVCKNVAIYKAIAMLPPPPFEDKFAKKEILCQQKENIQNQNLEKCLNEIEPNNEKKVESTTNEIEIVNEQESLNTTTKIKSGIYKIINKINGKYYVGSSKNIIKRWRIHKNQLNKNSHHNDYLQRAWNIYGTKSFEFCIVELVKNKTELLLVEQKYLDIAKSEQDNCYNLNWNAKGGDISEYSRLKLKHRNFSQEHRKKISDAQIGKPRSRETIQKMRVAMLGKKLSPEHKEKIRIANLGRTVSVENKIKLRERMLQHLKEGKINNVGANSPGARPIKVTFEDGRIETFDCIKYLFDKYPEKNYNNIQKLIRKEIRRIKDISDIEYL